jgi:hypothetical protein
MFAGPHAFAEIGTATNIFVYLEHKLQECLPFIVVSPTSAFAMAESVYNSQ